MKTLSKLKGVKEKLPTSAIIMEKTDKMTAKLLEEQMPPTILDDDIADWEHDNLIK
jgi:hypothetical protein